ncbi:MAG TPA: hypothetical protein VIL60_11300 [Rhodanobacter sp.]
MSKWLTRMLIISLSLLGLAACTSAPLKPAAPMDVPPGLTQTQIKTSIVDALNGRGWTVDEIKDGSIRSTLHLREHTATIRITFDQAQVRMAYVSSTNLDYGDRHGRQTIHRNYNGWIMYLEQDISRNLQNFNAIHGG